MKIRIIEDPVLREKFLGEQGDDRRRQRRYHRHASAWWAAVVPQTKGTLRLSRLHKRDARNG